MGYRTREQRPWGAAELILIGSPDGNDATLASPANDAALSGRRRPGFIYGARDGRQPAGAALGY